MELLRLTGFPALRLPTCILPPPRPRHNVTNACHGTAVACLCLLFAKSRPDYLYKHETTCFLTGDSTVSRSLPLSLAAVLLTTPALFAQQGPLEQAGRALDNAGKNIRARVENEVARGQTAAQEQDLLYRVTRRLEWDKQLVRSTVQIEAQPDGAVVLRGSVLNERAKRRAVDLVENTVGVTRVVDELAIVKEVKVIEAKPVPTRATTATPPVPERSVPPVKPE